MNLLQKPKGNRTPGNTPGKRLVWCAKVLPIGKSAAQKPEQHGRQSTGSTMSEQLLVLLLSGLMIFCLRIIDVSLRTLRIGFLVREENRLAGLFSFFESLI